MGLMGHFVIRCQREELKPVTANHRAKKTIKNHDQLNGHDQCNWAQYKYFNIK